MKKLKIFLLLSILLCFGFVLSSEVRAQGGGPKIFEVNDVLPATTQLRIYFNGGVNALESASNLASDNNNFYFIIEGRPEIFAFRDGEIYFEIFDYDEEIWITPFNGTTHNYMDIDTSSWSLSKRTISSVGDCSFTWEDLAPAPSGYTITFNSNGGSTIPDVEDATELPTLPIPTKENHIFLDWYYDSGFTNRAFTGDPLTGDVTLYAKYAKMFQVGDVLPAGLVRISWDEDHPSLMRAYFLEHHQIKSNINSYNFIERIGDNYYIAGINIMTLSAPGYPEFVPPYTGYGGGHSYVDVNTADWSILKRTISYVDWYTTTPSGTNYDARLYWEDLTPDGYTQGYQAAKEYYGWEDDGYWYTGEEAWDEGFEYGMEIYGYYDPITEQWLSVEEYLELYGTDKPGQSDFYGNFDKYFIPAMIIVFGGAILITALKVFKGRE